MTIKGLIKQIARERVWMCKGTFNYRNISIVVNPHTLIWRKGFQPGTGYGSAGRRIKIVCF